MTSNKGFEYSLDLAIGDTTHQPYQAGNVIYKKIPFQCRYRIIKNLMFYMLLMSWQIHILFSILFRYDSKKTDPTWICVFCHQGSHHAGLGDLFGPYFVSPAAVDIPARNTTPVGSPISYTHPGSPSPTKSKQELAVKFILGKHLNKYLKEYWKDFLKVL